MNTEDNFPAGTPESHLGLEDTLSHNGGTEASVVARSLTAIVDIGSNGIRFSISSRATHHARIMPCVFKDRLGISLFDAQLQDDRKSPIPQDVIDEIIRSMRRFKWVCEDFGVPSDSVKVVATEATREASNSVEFREAIFEATGWKVILLSKEEEGITGAYGVASSFHVVSGLFMDMGGGSTQLSWMRAVNGQVTISEHPVSLPYGAAALTHRLKHDDPKILYQEIKDAYKLALEKINIPRELQIEAEEIGGFRLFCCGGGLRGLGHLLIANEPDYPIQTIINGFSTTFDKVEKMVDYLVLKKKVPVLNNGSKVFRVSSRREQQLPAVGLLLSAAFESLPKIKTMHFSEGGVREGVLYSSLDMRIKSEDPMITATRPYSPLLAHKYLTLLMSALPSKPGIVPEFIQTRIIPALCNIAFVHCSYPKELQPTSALHVATSGIIAGSHGLSHRTRALIGIALCERWGMELPQSQQKYYQSLEKLVLESSPRLGESFLYWTKYCGKMMHVICGVHPGGNIRPGSLAFNFRCEVEDQDGEDEEDGAAGAGAGAISRVKKPKNAIVITLPLDGVKLSHSIKGRVIGLQKKIAKLNKRYQCPGKARVVVNYDNI